MLLLANRMFPHEAWANVLLYRTAEGMKLLALACPIR